MPRTEKRNADERDRWVIVTLSKADLADLRTWGQSGRNLTTDQAASALLAWAIEHRMESGL